MVLTGGLVLFIRKRNGEELRITQGRYEDDGHNGLRLYDEDDMLVETLESGTIAEWQVAGPDGVIIARNSPL